MNPSLWEEQQSWSYLKKNLIFALAKDLDEIGYDATLNKNEIRLQINHTTFQQNTKVLQKVRKVWEESTCHLGDADE